MEPSEQNYRILESYALEHGIALFGVARYDPVEARSKLSDREQDGLSFAISMGVRLSAQVLSGIGNCPTLLYQWHYRQANFLLDRVAFRMGGMIQEMGGACASYRGFSDRGLGGSDRASFPPAYRCDGRTRLDRTQ